MSGIQFGRFAPSAQIPEGKMLRACGQLTVTVSSRQTGKHMTLRLRCSRRDPDGPVRWPTVAFEQASHVFVDDFDGEEVAMYDPRHGVIAWNPRATGAARWTTAALLRYLAGADMKLIHQAEVATSAHCRKCGRELTDPESIERGFGSECWGEVTGSRPERAVA